MNKNLGFLGVVALTFALLLSSCSSASEAEVNLKGIISRLNDATSFDWKGSPTILGDQSEMEVEFWNSSGLIQDLFPSDQRECLIRVFVFKNDLLAKKAQASPFFDLDDQEGFYGSDWQFEDPVTKYGIILLDYGNPCSDEAASAFKFNISRTIKN